MQTNWTLISKSTDITVKFSSVYNEFKQVFFYFINVFFLIVWINQCLMYHLIVSLENEFWYKMIFKKVTRIFYGIGYWICQLFKLLFKNHLANFIQTLKIGYETIKLLRSYYIILRKMYREKGFENVSFFQKVMLHCDIFMCDFNCCDIKWIHHPTVWSSPRSYGS